MRSFHSLIFMCGYSPVIGGMATILATVCWPGGNLSLLNIFLYLTPFWLDGQKDMFYHARGYNFIVLPCFRSVCRLGLFASLRQNKNRLGGLISLWRNF